MKEEILKRLDLKRKLGKIFSASLPGWLPGSTKDGKPSLGIESKKKYAAFFLCKKGDA